MQIGPLRCWPGGLCLSRSIGDMDVGEFIVPIPHVKQIKVCTFLLSQRQQVGFVSQSLQSVLLHSLSWSAAAF